MAADNNKDVVRRFIEEVLAGGKIVEDDPITTPDLAQELGPLLGSPPA